MSSLGNSIREHMKASEQDTSLPAPIESSFQELKQEVSSLKAAILQNMPSSDQTNTEPVPTDSKFEELKQEISALRSIILQQAEAFKQLPQGALVKQGKAESDMESGVLQTSLGVPPLGTPPTPKSPYAYVFLFGGVRPEDFTSYRGYLFNVLIATRILREQGSQADVVLWVQIATKSPATQLPLEHENWLQKAGVQLRYIPKSKFEAFQDIIMQKFRILGMSEYRRCLFLDSDLMPLGNLDYFFELSDGPNAILKEDMIIAGNNIPMNAGYFMVAPKPGDYEKAQEIIQATYLDCYKKKFCLMHTMDGGNQLWSLIIG